MAGFGSGVQEVGAGTGRWTSNSGSYDQPDKSTTATIAYIVGATGAVGSGAGSTNPVVVVVTGGTVGQTLVEVDHPTGRTRQTIGAAGSAGSTLAAALETGIRG